MWVSGWLIEVQPKIVTRSAPEIDDEFNPN